MVPRSMLTKGAHTWQIQCISKATTANKDIAISEKRALLVGEAPNVTLVSPANSMLTKNTTHEFIFGYNMGDYGAEVADCYLHIRGNELGPLSLPTGSRGTIEINDLPREVLEWQVICNGVESEKRMLLIEPDKYTNVSIIYPQDLEQANSTSQKFEFIYNQGDNAPKNASCNLVISSKMTEYWVNATDGERAIIEAQNLSYGKNYWFIECWGGQNKSFAQSNERILEITDGEIATPVVNETKPVRNETLPQEVIGGQNETKIMPEQKSGGLDMGTIIIALVAIAVIAAIWHMVGRKKENAAAEEKPKKEERAKKE
jgi:hypothetical protein